MKKIDGIIFDVDGTLWNSLNSMWIAWQETLTEAGYKYDFTAEEMSKLFGQQIDRFGDYFFSDLSVEERRGLAKRCSIEQLDKMRKNQLMFPYEGVIETLNLLAKEYPLFIVTNANGGYVKLFTESTHTENCFKDFQEAGIPGYTKADNIRILMERNGLENAIYVGDTSLDQKSSQEAGIRFVWASYGFDHEVENDLVIDRFYDLPLCLKKIENDS